MTKAPPDGSLPNQLDEQAMYYDIRIRNQKILKKQGAPNGGNPVNPGGGTRPAGGSNPFDF